MRLRPVTALVVVVWPDGEPSYHGGVWDPPELGAFVTRAFARGAVSVEIRAVASPPAA